MSSMLFSPFKLGNLTLSNRVVMAPLTRSRSIGNIPGPLVAEYYGQRAGAGLIITEGTSPAANGLGYARIPGCFSPEQVASWRVVTDGVHARGGRIFLQMMHTGRASHVDSLPAGAQVLAPSAVKLSGTIFTDTKGLQPYSMPEAMSLDQLQQTVAEYVHSARSAVEAGFDGVELHSANGYLMDQFLNPASNQRTDAYGGSIANRNRFVLEVAAAVTEAIGKERVGIRLSPYGVFNEMAIHPELHEQFVTLVAGLSELGLVYLHVVDHSPMGAPKPEARTIEGMRAAFKGVYILSGGYDAARAEADLQAGKGELVAFGRPFISNPDLVLRLQTGAPLAQPDFATFYTPGEKGYTDYPSLA